MPLEKITIPITDPMHLLDMGRTHGLLMALDALNRAEHADRLPGLGMAKCVVQAAEAEQRVRVMQANFRKLFALPIDIDQYDVLWEGKPEIVCVPRGQGEQQEG